MRMIFNGWARQFMTHDRIVNPVELVGGAYKVALGDDRPLVWTGALKVLGKLNVQGLSGDYLVEFNFEQEELRNWLREFVKAEPEAALRLLAEMQAEALIELAIGTSGKNKGGVE